MQQFLQNETFFILLAPHRVISPAVNWSKPSLSSKGEKAIPVEATNCSEGRIATQENTFKKKNQCHRTVNAMYRYRHTVHLTLFLSSRNYFPPPIFKFVFVRKSLVTKQQKYPTKTSKLFPVNIFFNLLHCYASPNQFKLFLKIIIISTNGNHWLYLVICIICELMGYCAIK